MPGGVGWGSRGGSTDGQTDGRTDGQTDTQEPPGAAVSRAAGGLSATGLVGREEYPYRKHLVFQDCERADGGARTATKGYARVSRSTTPPSLSRSGDQGWGGVSDHDPVRHPHAALALTRGSGPHPDPRGALSTRARVYDANDRRI